MEVRKRVGYLPESVPLYRDMTALNYLMYIGEIRGIKNRRDRIPILSSVFPHINSTIGYYTSWMLQTAEPIHRIYLVTHPLSRQT